MIQFFKEFLGESPIEWMGILATLLGIYLTAQGKILCWAFNILASLIYAYVFYRSRLYADSFLQWVFIILSIWGWKNWQKGSFNKPIPVNKIRRNEWISGICISIISGLILGFLLLNYTNDSSPFPDGICFAMSVWATYLTARFILENWLVWVFTDLFYVSIYIQKGLYPTALLYTLLCVLAIIGYLNWRKSL